MQQQNGATKPVERTVIGVLIGWFLIALVISASGIFYGVPAPVVGFTNLLLVAITLLSIFLVRPFRSWVENVPLRWLVLYHTIRIVAGIGFLILYQRGALPSNFALVAGWGDILVGVTAGFVAAFALPVNTQTRWWIVLGWNIVGLLDIVRVLGTALQLGTRDPSQVIAITAFPMSMLPLFVVPLVFVTHVVIFVRLWQARSHLKRTPQ